MVELLVVLAVIALLLAVASPRYMQHVDHAREVALRENLHRIRDAIDKFYGDQGRYPADLDELVARHYLRAVPPDPFTDRRDTWVLVPPNGQANGGMFDLRSGAKGLARDGTTYASW